MTIIFNYFCHKISQPIDFLEKIAELEKQLHEDGGWNSSTINNTLESQFNHLVYLVDDDKIVAYCIYQALFEQAEIYRTGTNPDYQKQGYASQLLANLFTGLQEKGVYSLMLEVRADNYPAINLYHKHGFVQISVRPQYYKNKGSAVDALILERKII